MYLDECLFRTGKPGSDGAVLGLRHDGVGRDVRNLLARAGYLLLTGTYSGVLRLTPASSWAEMEHVPQPLTACAFASDHELLPSGPGGLLRLSLEDGTRQTLLAGPAGQVAWVAICSEDDASSIWIASADGTRLLRSRDDGASWQQLDAPFGILPLVALQAVSNRLLAATYDPRQYRICLWHSSDDGETWVRSIEAGTNWPFVASIDEAIRTVQFVRNKCLRKWMDEVGVSSNDLQCYCAILAKDYSFASLLNSQARQVAADRAWSAIARFFENCKNHKPGKKGYPRFQHDNRSVEYKTSGWKFDPDGKHIQFTDGCGIGRVRLVGNKKQRVATFPLQQVKRVRLIKRADGYYAQFCVKAERKVKHAPTGAQVGIDVGLKAFYTDSNGQTVANPHFLRKAERKLKRLHRHLSRTQKPSANRKKARQKLAKAYLKVNRQREDFARKAANALVSSHDLLAVEDLKIANLVRHHRLAKSISDAAWGSSLEWIRYYGAIHLVPIVEVAPHWTGQNCSGCGKIVKKSLGERTHRCVHCGLVMDRDENAARNILVKALQWLKEQSGCTEGHSETGLPARRRNASGQKTTTASQQ